MVRFSVIFTDPPEDETNERVRTSSRKAGCCSRRVNLTLMLKARSRSTNVRRTQHGEMSHMFHESVLNSLCRCHGSNVVFYNQNKIGTRHTCGSVVGITFTTTHPSNDLKKRKKKNKKNVIASAHEGADTSSVSCS